MTRLESVVGRENAREEYGEIGMQTYYLGRYHQ